MTALSRDLYSGAGAVLAELIQNADDSSYEPGVLPRMRVSVLPARTARLGLLVEVTELGYSAASPMACQRAPPTPLMTGE